MLNLTVLIDNETTNPTLAHQHGLSIWLQTASSRILFDAGKNADFIANACALNIEVESATNLVLSHGHYDHTGGVPALIEHGARPHAVIGPEFWAERRSSHPLGVPWQQNLLHDIVVNTNSYCVEPCIEVVNIGGTSDAASRHPDLQRLSDGNWEPDPFPDEQMLILQTICGLVIVTGCTHCGVNALLRRVRSIFGDTPIYALIGGLHLGSALPSDIIECAKSLGDIEHIWVNHCTGAEAYSIMRETLEDRVQWAGAGFCAELPPLK